MSWGDVGRQLVGASPIGADVYARYQRKQQAPVSGMGEQDELESMRAAEGLEAIQQANEAAGLDDLSKPGMGSAATAPAGTQSQWSRPANSSGTGIVGMAAGALMGLAEGALVTEPTVVRLGEREPEIVIPLNGRSGNKTSPAMLDGRYNSSRCA